MAEYRKAFKDSILSQIAKIVEQNKKNADSKIPYIELRDVEQTEKVRKMLVEKGLHPTFRVDNKLYYHEKSKEALEFLKSKGILGVEIKSCEEKEAEIGTPTEKTFPDVKKDTVFDSEVNRGASKKEASDKEVTEMAKKIIEENKDKLTKDLIQNNPLKHNPLDKYVEDAIGQLLSHVEEYYKRNIQDKELSESEKEQKAIEALETIHKYSSKEASKEAEEGKDTKTEEKPKETPKEEAKSDSKEDKPTIKEVVKDIKEVKKDIKEIEKAVEEIKEEPKKEDKEEEKTDKEKKPMEEIKKADLNTDGEYSAQDIAETFINGNISTAQKEVKTIKMFNEVLTWLEENAPKEVESFRRLIGKNASVKEEIKVEKKSEEIVEKKADEGNYRSNAVNDAKYFIDEFEDEIVSQILENGAASDDLYNDYGHGDAFIHETYVEKDYDLMEAAKLLTDLSDFEETDSGLWEGQEPRRAIATQAAFTYGQACTSFIQDLIKEINEKVESLPTSDIKNKVKIREIVRSFSK